LTLAHDALVGRQEGGHAEVLRALLLAMAVPSVAVAGAWHARRRALAYESLFPAGRDAFAREVAAAVAVDVAVYWLAAAAGAVASVAFTRPEWLASPLLAGGLAASAAAQCLAVGGLLLAMHARAAAVHVITPTSVSLIGAALLSALWPHDWSPDPQAAPEHLRVVLFAGLAVAAIGAALSAVAIAEWRHADLA
jgi:hypothetical protein